MCSRTFGVAVALVAMAGCSSPPGASRDAAVSDAALADAALLDAPLDARTLDAPPADAPLADAQPPDARGPGGAGDLCGTAPNWCLPNLDCWVLLESGVPFCTESCRSPSDCTAPGYGADPCCAPPGSQTLETVCIPRGDPACPVP